MVAAASAPLALHALLARVHGIDISKLAPVVRTAFMQDAAQGFITACRDLQTVVLNESEPDRGWLWQCEQAANFDSEWIASFSLVKVDHLAAMAGASMRVQMAAATNPGMKFTVDFFADCSQANATAAQAMSKLKISVAVSGDPELMIAEACLEAVDDDFQQGRPGVDVLVVAGTSSGDEFKNPHSIRQAFGQAAESVRLAGAEQSAESSITETVYIELEVSHAATAEDLRLAILTMGKFFTGSSNALQYI